MTPRILKLCWLAVGILAACAVFDWWMYRATQDYLFEAIQFEQGRAPEPDLAARMADARFGGFWRAAFWFVVLTGGGWLTIHWSRTTKDR